MEVGTPPRRPQPHEVMKDHLDERFHALEATLLQHNSHQVGAMEARLRWQLDSRLEALEACSRDLAQQGIGQIFGTIRWEVVTCTVLKQACGQWMLLKHVLRQIFGTIWREVKAQCKQRRLLKHIVRRSSGTSKLVRMRPWTTIILSESVTLCVTTHVVFQGNGEAEVLSAAWLDNTA